MSKSVNIDGKDYIIENCDSCPFYNDGDCGYDSRCQHPKSPSAMVRTGFDSEGIAEDCPLKEYRDQNGMTVNWEQFNIIVPYDTTMQELLEFVKYLHTHNVPIKNFKELKDKIERMKPDCSLDEECILELGE